MKNGKSDHVEYAKNIARHAFRNMTRIEENYIEKTVLEYEEPKSAIPQNKIHGLALGLAIGIIVCIGASFCGIPFKPTEIAFITAQFGLLGGVVSFLNS